MNNVVSRQRTLPSASTNDVKLFLEDPTVAEFLKPVLQEEGYYKLTLNRRLLHNIFKETPAVFPSNITEQLLFHILMENKALMLNQRLDHDEEKLAETFRELFLKEQKTYILQDRYVIKRLEGRDGENSVLFFDSQRLDLLVYKH